MKKITTSLIIWALAIIALTMSSCGSPALDKSKSVTEDKSKKKVRCIMVNRADTTVHLRYVDTLYRAGDYVNFWNGVGTEVIKIID